MRTDVKETLTQSPPPAIAAFLTPAMFSLGLDLTIRKIIEPRRNRRLVAVALFRRLPAPASAM